MQLSESASDHVFQQQEAPSHHSGARQGCRIQPAILCNTYHICSPYLLPIPWPRTKIWGKSGSNVKWFQQVGEQSASSNLELGPNFPASSVSQILYWLGFDLSLKELISINALMAIFQLRCWDHVFPIEEFQEALNKIFTYNLVMQQTIHGVRVPWCKNSGFLTLCRKICMHPTDWNLFVETAAGRGVAARLELTTVATLTNTGCPPLF